MYGALIVGSGFSGLGMAISLRAAGLDDFVVLEGADAPGGTWRDNTYPGCACDVPSHLYSFSFEPNPDWSHAYSPRAEIQAYLERCRARHDIDVSYGKELTRAEYRHDHWRVETSDGSGYQARALILATGPFHSPSIPDLPGLRGYQNPTWHSARWRHDVDLTGQRVAVVGTGASAVQFVPEIARVAAHVDVYQRTPPWILPSDQRRYSDAERAAFRRDPGRMRRLRRRLYWSLEQRALAFAHPAVMARFGEGVGRRHLARQVSDPRLREALTPRYRMGCKRVLRSDDFYPTLGRPDVDLVTDPIAEVTADAVVTRDGTRRAADVLIFGTGFDVVDGLRRLTVIGRDGQRLDGTQAYLGTTVAGFPDLYLLLGPNTGLGHNSVIFMVEQQIRYVLAALRRNETLEVRPEVQAAYNRTLQAKLRRTVWAAGCHSWYLDADGVNRTLWPGWSWRYATRLRTFRRSDYVGAARG
jgi:cation diffusion facilitator CzcD-associated flavoprotein CzcO